MSPSPYTAALQNVLYTVQRPTLLPLENPANTSAVAFDSNVARRSYERFAASWSKLPTAGLTFPNVDVDYVVPQVVQRAREIATPAMRERFARLPEFDIACYDDLEGTAWGLWYCHHQRASEKTRLTYAKVPLPLWKQAEALDQKMVRVLEYNAVKEGDPEDPVAASLAALSLHEGNRYERTSHRLLGLAALYEDPRVAPLLADDRKRYDPADAAQARGLSAQIVMELNADKRTANFWDAQLMRAWAALDRCYAQVRRAMLYLDAEHGADARFLKVRSFVRPAARKPDAEKAPPAPQGDATTPAAPEAKKSRARNKDKGKGKGKAPVAPANDATREPAAPQPPGGPHDPPDTGKAPDAPSDPTP